MKITRSQFQTIIKECVYNILNEHNRLNYSKRSRKKCLNESFSS